MSLHLLQIQALVTAQLKLDLRHPKTGSRQTSRLALTVIAYALSAGVLAVSLAERGVLLSEFLFASVSFTAVLAAFGVAGSYDDLMGRHREISQSLAFPIASKTLYVARLINVGIFALIMGISATAPLALTATFMYGSPVGMLMLGTLIVMMLGVTFAVLAVLWVLTLTAPIRLQRVSLSLFRALLVGAIVLGYQWVATQDTLLIAAGWWPAYWVVLAVLEANVGGWIPLVATAVLLMLAFAVVLPGQYARLLSRSAEAETTGAGGRSNGIAPRAWESWAVTSAAGRAAFGMAAAALHNDRLVRGRVWPTALLALVFAGFGAWTGGLGDLFVHGARNVLFDPAIAMHLSVLTVLLFSVQSAVQSVQVSDNPEASWSFDVLPVRGHRALQIGAQQALLFRVVLPLHVVLGVILALSMPLTHAFLHTAFWFGGCAVLMRLQALTRRQAPFTSRSDRFSAGERMLPLLLALPMAIVLMILQSLTFNEPLSALLIVIGLLVGHTAMNVQLSMSSGRDSAEAAAAAVPALEP